MKKSSIRRKIMGAILLTSSIVMILLIATYLFFAFGNYKRMLKNNTSTLGAIIAANSSGALAFDSPADAVEILGALKNNPHIVAAALYNKQGHLFAVYPQGISTQALPAHPTTEGYNFKKGYLEGFEPVLQQTDRLGTLFIQSDLKQLYVQLGNLIFVVAFLFIILLVIAYLLSVFLQKRIARPILVLQNTARTVSERNDYTLRAIKTSDDELGSLTDAFNRMLAQIELQNQAILEAVIEASRLAAIVETSNDPIISMKLDGIITSWNDSAERTFGYSANEMIGQSIMKIVPQDKSDEEADVWQRLQMGERIEQLETKRLTKFNDALDVSLTISPIKDAQGKIIGSSKIARDITDKKYEERRKNDFIGMVSHELKTPLTSVRSYVQVLLKEAKKHNSDAFIINALTRTDVQTKKMSHLIQDFLNLARLEEGKLQPLKQTFVLQPLIEEIATDAQFLTTNHTIKYSNSKDLKVNADREKIGQVLMNLLTNAIKYSPRGGDIVINCQTDDDKATISVADSGVGISANEQQNLFNRFYRVNNEKIKTISGFGIGLYLVSEILRYHQSKIRVESEEGKGSTFYFSLTIAD